MKKNEERVTTIKIVGILLGFILFLKFSGYGSSESVSEYIGMGFLEIFIAGILGFLFAIIFGMKWLVKNTNHIEKTSNRLIEVVNNKSEEIFLKKENVINEEETKDKMVEILNILLNFEKYNLTEKEFSTKNESKEKYYNYHSKMNKKFVYIIQEEMNGYIKIGKADDPLKRIVNGFGAKSPYKLKVVCLIPASDVFGLEKWLHSKFDHKRINGEWFSLNEEEIASFELKKYPKQFI